MKYKHWKKVSTADQRYDFWMKIGQLMIMYSLPISFLLINHKYLIVSMIIVSFFFIIWLVMRADFKPDALYRHFLQAVKDAHIVRHKNGLVNTMRFKTVEREDDYIFYVNTNAFNYQQFEKRILANEQVIEKYIDKVEEMQPGHYLVYLSESRFTEPVERIRKQKPLVNYQ